MPHLYIIAGPNGAGKTTASLKLLPRVFHIKEFVNADEIAKGLSPLNPEGAAITAGRVMLQRIEQLLNEKEDFSIETTLASKSYLNLIAKAKDAGYQVSFVFFYLNNWLLAKQRVAKRVSSGGHNIPEKDIERRFRRGLENVMTFASAVNDWYIFDNSEGKYKEIAKGYSVGEESINFELWNKIKSYENK